MVKINQFHATSTTPYFYFTYFRFFFNTYLPLIHPLTAKAPILQV